MGGGIRPHGGVLLGIRWREPLWVARDLGHAAVRVGGGFPAFEPNLPFPCLFFAPNRLVFLVVLVGVPDPWTSSLCPLPLHRHYTLQEYWDLFENPEKHQTFHGFPGDMFMECVCVCRFAASEDFWERAVTTRLPTLRGTLCLHWLRVSETFGGLRAWHCLHLNQHLLTVVWYSVR